MYVRLHWELARNMNETQFLMYCGLVITENMMINKGALIGVQTECGSNADRCHFLSHCLCLLLSIDCVSIRVIYNNAV